jgi:hypothetical protein
MPDKITNTPEIYIYIIHYLNKQEFSGKMPQCENTFNVIMLQQFFEFFKELSKEVSINLI